MNNLSTVAPGVFGIEVGDINNMVYLVVSPDSRACFIDSGYDVAEEVDAIVAMWQSTGKPTVEGIILTHRHYDHAGGAAKLSEMTGGPIIATEVEKPFIDEEAKQELVTRTVGDTEILNLGGTTLEFVHVPGHTKGSVCVYHREEKIMFTGDTVLGGSPTTVIPGQGDMGEYLESLRKLMTYDLRLIAPGHGPVIDDPYKNLEDLIEHRLFRERQTLDLVREGKGSIAAIFSAIYTGLPEHLHRNARMQIEAHLLKLAADGAIYSIADGNYEVRSDA